MKVNKRWLLFIAGVVWFIAGFNIMRIGAIAFNGYITVTYIFWSLTIFLAFHNFVFRKMVKKHTKRITTYEDIKHNVFKFFNKQAYIIMFSMITFGIALRLSNLLPDICIAVFYSGLGASLIIAGISFVIRFHIFSIESRS